DVMLAARNGEQLTALTERLRSAHQIGATAHVVDLRKAEDIARLAKEAADIDILVNNAGDIPGGSIDKIDEATWRHAWDLKVFGYINLTREIYAQMKAKGGGVIVNDIGCADVVDDHAAALGLHLRVDLTGEVNVAEHFQVPGVPPGRFVDLVDGAARDVAGIIDEDVDVGGFLGEAR